MAPSINYQTSKVRGRNMNTLMNGTRRTSGGVGLVRPPSFLNTGIDFEVSIT